MDCDLVALVGVMEAFGNLYQLDTYICEFIKTFM